MTASRLIGTNYGVIGTLSSVAVRRLGFVGAWVLYGASLVVFFCVLCGIVVDWNWYVRVSMAFWIGGNAWRRLVPVLWAEEGKTSYLPLPKGAGPLARQRDRSLQWWTRFYQTLWATVMISMACVARLFTAGGVAGSSTAFRIVFWSLPLFNLVSPIYYYGYSMFASRMAPDPDSGVRASLVVSLVASFFTVPLIPVMMTPMAVFSCVVPKETGAFVMAVAPTTLCGGVSHRLHSVMAAVFLALAAFTAETAMGAVRFFRAPFPATDNRLFRSSPFVDEMLLLFNWLSVFVFTLGPTSASDSLAAVGVISALRAALVIVMPASSEKIQRAWTILAAVCVLTVNVICWIVARPG